jgi:structure-specific recognition protein 1
MLMLSKPLNQGNTMHHFLLIQIDKAAEEKVKVNLSQAEIDTHYGGLLEPEMQGPLDELISRLFKAVVGISKILIPGEFKSAKDGKSEGIQCSVKVQDGMLYPMSNSLIYITKPILYIKHKDIKYVEF